MAKLALTNRRKMDVDGYIFPEDYYDIPELTGFQDVGAVERYAERKLSNHAGQEVDLYLNGGMSIEMLACVKASAKLAISLNVVHYDNLGDRYVVQPIRWRPQAVRSDRDRAPAEILGLCKRRHADLPGKKIFDTIPDELIFDFSWLDKKAKEVLGEYSGKNVAVYLSGLTSAYLSVLNVASDLGVGVTCFHYDYNTEDYFPQVMT